MPRLKFCVICNQKAHGSHFGAVTCRACAAFFKRAILSKRVRKECKFNKSCVIFDGENYTCKSCRFQKCLEAGMNGKPQLSSRVIQSIETFVGRPTIVHFVRNHAKKHRTFIDVKFLVDLGAKSLKNGCPTPIFSQSFLEKISFSIDFQNDSNQQLLTITRKHASEYWEYEFLQAARFLTHFNEFVKLPHNIQIQLLHSTWHVWGRLHKVLKTARFRKNSAFTKSDIFFCDNSFVDLKNLNFDVSWITPYSLSEVQYFMDACDGSWPLNSFVDEIIQLEPSPIEISFMYAQLCFQYAGNRLGGEISKICDGFMEVLANDLHNYYTFDREKRHHRVYSGRLSQMLRVNQGIQASIRNLRERTHIARTFDIFTADFSHPEMFIDTGCA